MTSDLEYAVTQKEFWFKQWHDDELSPDIGRVKHAVWVRDAATCQECFVHADHYKGLFHVHHIVPRECEALFSEETNLVLLCNTCHRWVHGKKNTEFRWIGSEVPAQILVPEPTVVVEPVIVVEDEPYFPPTPKKVRRKSWRNRDKVTGPSTGL